MDTNELLVPVILEGVSWVKEKLGPSKKELKLKIADLESQIKALSYGNLKLVENMEQIVNAVLDKLKLDGNYTIYADTIVKIENNNGMIITNDTIHQTNNTWLNLFDDLDAEILKTRITKPSDEVE